jgi:hypothetical protein
VALYAAPPARPIWPAMLPMLMMFPLPRATILGARAATRKYAGRTLARKSWSKVATSQLVGRAEPGDPGIVDQHVDSADLFGEVSDLGGIVQISGHEAGFTSPRDDAVDDRFAAGGVAAVHDHFGTVIRQVVCRRFADTRGRPRHQGAQPP